MKTKLISCISTKNEALWLGAGENIDYEFLDFSYHANNSKLHSRLQEIIDQSQDYDLISLACGNCSNCSAGLYSDRVPLLLPATSDCIGLLLGSEEQRKKLHCQNPATYYFSQGWLDYGRNPLVEYQEYVEIYGEERARNLIGSLYGRYERAVLIITPGIKNINKYRQKLKDITTFFNWQAGEVIGNLNLLYLVVKGIRGPGTVYVEPGNKVCV
ncbi:DUF1638 domain-containing protein [Pelotomaculum propionicicum]|uniref:DUF1638 domain-containing protein n=1 Tax=Pelotomaculum propionicicum TaxID=258475 RepID=A0A4Y7RJR6_9FIRM|nr:DUF1638 domain-containing protein [Pelotomaculum propionicicum]NLI12182.1 DUF1638 domain-containing protein [Peptococcaceae bacterium]TEB09051.1 hypothetical protein Pmgp_03443 [Pelotomaculum propionicicum]